MYEISDQIASQPFDELQVQKLIKTDVFEILSISLEKNATFPKHFSATHAQLIVLEGDITSYINGHSYKLTKQQHFNFPNETVHHIVANENSKFLIIR